MVSLEDRPGLLVGAGTPETTWRTCGRFSRLPRFEPGRPGGRVVVVSPHPDDEVLGVGGTLVALARSGAPLHLVAVTDGEASHPHCREELRRARPLETAAALKVLRLQPAGTLRLGLADGHVVETEVIEALDRIVAPSDLLLAPWSRDGHPDHDACGRAAEEVARRTGCDLFQYLVWAWHWATPDEIPWDRGCKTDLTPQETKDKRRAARTFVTQLSGPAPILPSSYLRRLTRQHEVLLSA